MRRSTQSSRPSAFVSLPATDVHRLSQRMMWLMLAFGLALGISGGAAGTALAQPDGYEMRAYVANCQIVPPLPPTLNEAGCVPAVGAYVELIADDGTFLGACTASQVLPGGLEAGCSVIVPFNTSGQAYLDTSTIDGNFAPQRNPIPFRSPGPGPVDGIVGFPIFVNLPAGGGGTSEQPVDQSGQPGGGQQEQQAAPADRYATVIAGTCADPGSEAADPIAVYTPQGDPLGLPTAVIAESGGGAIGVALDDLFASPHAIIVVTPSDGQGTDVACGDVGTVADDDGIAVIGLLPAQGSSMAGIAYLATDQGTGQTMVSIFLAEGLGETA